VEPGELLAVVSSLARRKAQIRGESRRFTRSCSAALIRNFRLPFYPSILAVSLIAGIIWYRLITFDFTQSVPGAAESSFGDSLNFILLLWVLFARLFWFRDHFIPFVETCSRGRSAWIG
jgi:hypothetical protein